ncbi:kinase-like domain-containing protein [Trichoderma aethiopicum]
MNQAFGKAAQTQTVPSTRSGDSSAFDLAELSRALVIEGSRPQSDGRLVVAYPPNINLVLDEDSAVTPLGPILGGYRPSVITQVPDKPAFRFRLPCQKILRDNPLEKLNCQIIYHPTNNNCTLIHDVRLTKGSQIFLTNIDDPPARLSVARLQPCVLTQGFWRASATVGGADDASEYDLAYIQVLQRKFTVPISPDPDLPVRKRRAPGDSEDSERPAKRQKWKASLQIDIALFPDSSPSTTNVNNRVPVLPPRPTTSRGPTSVLDLEDGYMATIPGTIKGGLSPYELRQRHRFAKSQNAIISISVHSGIKDGEIAVKALLYDSLGHDLWSITRMWMRETTILRYMNHDHIVNVKDFDARVFAIYYESLPPSLARGKWSSLPPDAAEMVLDQISSALAYMAARNIVHNDIRPANIAFSGSHAILFNFGLVTQSGDVWALGVTMLYLLGKMSLPDDEEAHDARTENGTARDEEKTFRSRAKHVAECKAKLNKDNAVESLVFQMLDEIAESRIQAADVESALGRREGEQVLKSQDRISYQ